MQTKNIAIVAALVLGVVGIVVVISNKKSPATAPAKEEKAEKGGHEGHGSEGEEGKEGVIELGDDQIEAAGIVLATAAPGALRTEAVFPAEVKLNADNVAHIFPRFTGVVKGVRKAIGDRVKKGDVLALVESNESLSNYEIRSLIDGTIIERHVTLGETIRDDAESFVVADLSSVWVDLNVYPKDLALVKKGNSVRIVAAAGEGEAEGKVAYVAPVVSEHTRTALARVIVPNPNGQWQPGTFVNAYVVSQAIEVPLVIARDAVQTINGATTVFVETESGGFRATVVGVGRRTNKEVEILSGLKNGDRYVAKGTFVLKAELGKAEAGHSHE